MTRVKFISFVVLITTLVSAYAQGIDPNQVNFFEGISLPSYNYEPLNVTDQHQRWTLQIRSEYRTTWADFYGTLYDSQSQISYIVYANEELSPYKFQISPDLKWASVYNICMRGASYNGEFSFNLTINYADFWSNTPANKMYNWKQIENPDDASSEDCTIERIKDGAENYPLSQGFWLTFDFDDGSHLSFNIPVGIVSYVHRDKFLSFSEGG